jgi:hypothetical protein
MSVLKTIGIQHLNGSSQAVTLQSNNNVTFANNVYIRGQTGQVTNPLQIKFSNDYPGAGGASSNTADKMKLVFYDNSPIDIYSIGVGPSADMQYHAYQGSFGQGSHNFYTENLLRMKIDGSGRVTKPYQPAFHARSAGGAFTNQVISFGVVNENEGGHYNTGNSRFTAPVAGRYMFSVFALTPNDASVIDLRLWINGSNPEIYGGYAGNNVTGHKQVTCVFIVRLNASDYVDIRASGTSTLLTSAGMHHGFSGFLIG